MNVHGPTPRAVLVGPLRIFLAALLVGCVPGAASAGWSRLSTKQVVFVGDAPDAIIRRVAQKLDQFREVLTRALPGADTKSPVPTVVVVFRNDRSLTPYKPLFQGRPVKVAGFFQAAEDVNYIAVNGEADEEALTQKQTVAAEFLRVVRDGSFIPPSMTPTGFRWVMRDVIQDGDVVFSSEGDRL